MIASFMIFVLRKAGTMSSEYDSQMSANELVKFNSQFEAYAKEDNTFFDVITVANLAYDVNKRNGWDSKNGVTIEIYENANAKYSVKNQQNQRKDHFFNNNNNEQEYIYAEIIKDYATTKESTEKTEYQYKFSGEITQYNEVTGKVEKMKFTRKNN